MIKVDNIHNDDSKYFWETPKKNWLDFTHVDLSSALPSPAILDLESGSNRFKFADYPDPTDRQITNKQIIRTHTKINQVTT